MIPGSQSIGGAERDWTRRPLGLGRSAPSTRRDAPESIHRLDAMSGERPATTSPAGTSRNGRGAAERCAGHPHRRMNPRVMDGDDVALQPSFQRAHCVHAVLSDSLAESGNHHRVRFGTISRYCVRMAIDDLAVRRSDWPRVRLQHARRSPDCLHMPSLPSQPMEMLHVAWRPANRRRSRRVRDDSLHERLRIDE